MKIYANQNLLKSLSCLLMIVLAQTACGQKPEWNLVWSEEFEYSGAPAEESWAYELGIRRELGWKQRGGPKPATPDLRN